MIRFIFALYILFLAVYPCSDRETCAGERKTDFAFVNAMDHQHTSSEQDFCTPFCICSCCAAHIQLHHVADITFAMFAHNTQVATRYLEMPLPDKTSSIWQPPRIS